MTVKEFSKYFVTFQSDPLNKTVGLKDVNPKSWKHFGPLYTEDGTNYTEYTEEPSNSSANNPGGNTHITDIGFNFEFNGDTFNKFIASPHGWLCLLASNNIPTSSLHKIYDGRFLVSGSSSYVNSAIKEDFVNNDVLLAPWFDRLMMTHKDLDSFVTFYSGSSTTLQSHKQSLLYGNINTEKLPIDALDYGMKYTVLDDSVNGKSLVVRWTSLGYEYRGYKLAFETVLYKNGKIEFNYAPIDTYSTQYTLLEVSSDPVSVWKLDESSGSTAFDETTSYNLTYSTPNNMRPTAGKINTAAFFSGSWSNFIIYNGGLSPQDFANFTTSESFSFSAWFKTALNDTSTKTLISRMETGNKGYAIKVAGGYVRFELTNNFNTVLSWIRTPTDVYNDANWHHVVATYSGTGNASGMKLYVDGALISTVTDYDTLSNASFRGADGSARFLIGAQGRGSTSGNTTNFFTGSIDDVAMWYSALTSSDVSLIYQNGLQGVSVADIDPIGDSTNSYATCGIFASGSSTWNFRDSATLLGTTQENRLMSSFGGALYTGSFVDSDSESSNDSAYSVNLNLTNWPKHGGRITFSPPVEKIKLIKSDHSKYKDGLIYKKPGFDDRKILNYSEQEDVEASTSIPLGYLVNSQFPGVELKQNLYKDGGILFDSRKVLKGSSDYFMNDDLELFEKSGPFSEQALFDQDKNDVFFNAGTTSAFGSRNTSFIKKLSSKKQIKLQFAVNKKTKMFTSASSLYYFNIDNKQWNIPFQSISEQPVSSFRKLSVNTNNVAGGACSGSLYLEDHIAFDSQGNCIASGSLDIFRSTSGGVRNQSTPQIGTAFNLSSHINLVTPEYPKSMQRNSNFSATNNELFSLPLNEPFLLEKAAIEIPFLMGDSWFSDKTTYLIASASNFAHTATLGGVTSLPSFTWYEEGGPAITVALFCQRKQGQNTVRDLVLKSTFSHVDDKDKTTTFYNIYSGSSSLTHVSSLLGNKSNNNIMSGAFIQYDSINSKKVFTGSVLIKASSDVTNCAHIGINKIFTMSDYSSSGSMLADFENFLNTELLPVNSESSNLTYLLSIDPLGRSMSGFGPDSVGESLTTLGVLSGSTVTNPYYFSASYDRQAVTSSLESNFALLGTGSYLYCTAKVPLGKPKQMPYIIYPEDKLVLAVSKSRPAYRFADLRLNDNSLSTGKINSVISSSYFNYIQDPEGHEVYFDVGTVNITLYGSNVQLGEEVEQ